MSALLSLSSILLLHMGMSKEAVTEGNGFVSLGHVQSLVDKLSLTERKQLSVYLQQHLTKDIISLLPIPLASHLLEFLDAETLCKIRQGIFIKNLGFLKKNNISILPKFIIIFISLHEAKWRLFIYLFVVLYCINKKRRSYLVQITIHYTLIYAFIS